MMSLIRCMDVILSLIGIIILSPLLFVVALLVRLTSSGAVFYLQNRVGKDGKDFRLYKFRTMYTSADQKGHLTVGGRDKRITRVGYYLRKFKIDELPQLLNVLKGEMSIVGPRPELRRYVDLYTEEQRKALQVVPGITDYASIAYRNENELLALAENPEEYYVNEVMPRKIELNFKYISNRTLPEYFKIIGKTLVTAVKGR